MGEISVEPSMEEILSSIKRIIAEEGETPGRQRRPARTPSPQHAAPPADEVLELSDPMPVTAEAPPPPPAAPADDGGAERIMSSRAVQSSRGALEALSRASVRPEATGEGSLEGLVREMLRPMLREWLDAHLPEMVEAMVSREIARISGQGR